MSISLNMAPARARQAGRGRGLHLASRADSGSLDRQARIFALWDGLGEFSMAQTDQAMDWLLEQLGRLFQADAAVWMGLGRDANGQGWHCRAGQALPDSSLTQAIRLTATAAGLNRWQAACWRDSAIPHFKQAEPKRIGGGGCRDAVWAVCPVAEGFGLLIGVFRTNPAAARFSRAECDDLLLTLRGLKGYCRRHLLSFGPRSADSRLTAAERSVLLALLDGARLAEIAAATGRSEHTIHHHCKTLHQKFGVSNRAALMALWLN